MPRLIALIGISLLSLGAVSPSFSAGPNVASCATATDGTPFGTVWLSCSAAVSYVGPTVPATTPIAVQRNTSGVYSNQWTLASNLNATDRVWGNASATATSASWFSPAGVLTIGTGPPPGQGKITATWLAPTTNTDGSPITLPLTYSLFAGPSGLETPYQSGISGLTATLTGLQTVTPTCVTVIAIDSAGASAPSLEACALAKAPSVIVPNAPPKLTLSTTQVSTP